MALPLPSCWRDACAANAAYDYVDSVFTPGLDVSDRLGLDTAPAGRRTRECTSNAHGIAALNRTGPIPICGPNWLQLHQHKCVRRANSEFALHMAIGENFAHEADRGGGH
jgi:hypothetical protein